ncbi:MAG: hypothetical protein WDA06_05630, partial [Phenylobacterium sp.]
MNRINKIRNLIIKARQAYYYGGSPIMTDATYDALEDELRKESPNDPLLNTVGAPIPPKHILQATKHKMPMGSQNKVKKVEEFIEWAKKYTSGKIHASWKADGGSAAAYYENGELKVVVSRGDGYVGENITSNAVKFQGLPIFIDSGQSFTGSIRFEAVLTKENWNIVGGKNPRNSGNGIIGRKDGVGSEYINAFAFDIVDENKSFTTEEEKLQYLEKLGFQTIPWKIVTTDEAIQWFEKLCSDRGVDNNGKLPFWIDGAVFKANEIKLQEKHGESGGCPRAQVAWKPEASGAITVLRSVEITGGHTGALIPNARFDPVQISGTTVSNAILNNWNEIERLGIAIGDTIWVEKANDIIPKVINVIDRPINREIIYEPTQCPFCGANTERKKITSGQTGAVTICTNEECPKKSINKIKKWIKSLDILGIGDSVLENMVDILDINSPADLYTLDKNKLATLELSGVTFGESRANAVVDEINKKKELTLPEFLGSLGIHLLGKRKVKIMMDNADGELDSLGDWLSGKLRDQSLANKAGVPKTNNVIQDSIDATTDTINKLLANGVIIVESTKAKKTIKGTVCI